MSPTDPRHGTPAGRKAHQAAGQPTCAACARACARYEQELQLDRLAGRPRMIPAAGTRRRVQALVALGHTFQRIADALEITQAAACALAHRPAPLIRSSTAARVATLYDAWSMTLPPTATPRQRKAASYARTVAAKHDWAPPLAWDSVDHDPQPPTDTGDQHVDWVVVERLLAGDTTVAATTTTAERHAITDAWLDTGRSWNDLERLTGWKHGRYGRTRPTHRKAAA